MANYVNIVAFSNDLKNVVVLTKLRGPEFLIGKDNIPGGHIEDGETPEFAALRELKEETNLDAPTATKIAYKSWDGGELHTFVTRTDLSQLQSSTDEPVRIEDINQYMAHLVLNPETAAPDIPDLITKGLKAIFPEVVPTSLELN